MQSSSQIITNKPTPSFYRPDALPAPHHQCQSTEGKISYSMDLFTPTHLGVFLSTLSLTANSSGLPWECCHASHQLFDASSPSLMFLKMQLDLWHWNHRLFCGCRTSDLRSKLTLVFCSLKGLCYWAIHSMRNNCSGIVAAESPAAVARAKGSGRETDTLDRNILKTY